MRNLVNGKPRKLKPKTTWIDPKYDTGNGGRSIKQLFNEASYFDNPKSPVFISDVIKIGSEENSIILDFFAGSATTAHAIISSPELVNTMLMKQALSLETGRQHWYQHYINYPMAQDRTAAKTRC